MSYFLIVYDRSTGDVELKQYGDHERERAMRDRFKRELAERDRPEVEVVVLGAASLDALRNTHARYFRTARQLAEDAFSDS